MLHLSVITSEKYLCIKYRKFALNITMTLTDVVLNDAINIQMNINNNISIRSPALALFE